MRLSRVMLRNVGPFARAEIDFASPEDGPGVTILTGENGTGKSVLIDAMRALLRTREVRIGRNLVGREDQWEATLDTQDSVYPPTLVLGGGPNRVEDGLPGQLPWDQLWEDVPAARTRVGWILDFWQSGLASDPFAIKTLDAPVHERFLADAMAGSHSTRRAPSASVGSCWPGGAACRSASTTAGTRAGGRSQRSCTHGASTRCAGTGTPWASASARGPSARSAWRGWNRCTWTGCRTAPPATKSRRTSTFAPSHAACRGTGTCTSRGTPCSSPRWTSRRPSCAGSAGNGAVRRCQTRAGDSSSRCAIPARPSRGPHV